MSTTSGTRRAPRGRAAGPVAKGTTRAAVAGLLLAAAGGCRDLDSFAGPAAPNGPRVAAAAATRGAPIPGQYIVVFNRDVPDAPGLARRLAAEHGGELTFSYASAIKGFAARLPEQAAAALRRNPNVALVEQDAVVGEHGAQSDPPSWGLDRIDQRLRPMDRSYSYATDGAGVSVYILDTGVRTTHSDFGGRAYGAFTAIADGNGTNDCRGHGTHVAGTVGGTQYGVAKGARLYAVRVLDCTGNGSYSGIIAGIDWVTRNRVLPAVANMSLGGAKSSAVNAAVQGSIDAGVVYVVAAGNNGADACGYSPASAPGALTTGASWNGDGFSGFSNRGSCVDIVAPGEAIRSASHLDDVGSTLKGGTSMAAPHVAGVAALYLSAHPTASVAQVAAAITGNATANVLTDVPSGTANLLLSSEVTLGAAPAPAPPAADQAPVARFTASCSRGRCTFDASASSDDKGIVSYRWDYGDGTAAVSGDSLVTASHSYTAPGRYTVRLTVTDAAAQRSTTSAVAHVKKL